MSFDYCKPEKGIHVFYANANTITNEVSPGALCQCGKTRYGEDTEKPPDLGIHVSDGIGSRDKVGG